MATAYSVSKSKRPFRTFDSMEEMDKSMATGLGKPTAYLKQGSQDIE